jgi:arylsulfatase A-like enzyme
MRMSNAPPPAQRQPSDSWRGRQPIADSATVVPRRSFLQRVGIGAGLVASTLVGFMTSGALRHPTAAAAHSTTPTSIPPTATLARPTAAPASPPALPTPAIAIHSAAPAPAQISRIRQPNVLLITVDTLRADHLGAYGFTRAHTPNLDQFAQQGVRFDRAICQLPQTNASHAALLTGLYPSTNGLKIHMVDKIHPGIQTMAGVFAKAGYRTGGIYSWVSLDPQFSGLNQGFQSYDGFVLNRSLVFSDPRLEELAALYRQLKQNLPILRTADLALNSSEQIESSIDGRADVTNAAVFHWLDQNAGDTPFFLWVHYFDPHYPYNPPAGYDHVFGLSYQGKIDGSVNTIHDLEQGKLAPTDADKARLTELYHGEVAFVDNQLGQLFGELQRRGLADDTAVVITADHGESFGEHGDWVHGLKVFESEIRVPLLVRFPHLATAAGVVTAPVQLIDVMPTLLELTGLKAPKPIQGASFAPLLKTPGRPARRIAFTELADEAFVSLETAEWKLIRNNANGQQQLFHLTQDEAEANDLIRTETTVARELSAQIQDLMKLSGVSR